MYLSLSLDNFFRIGKHITKISGLIRQTNHGVALYKLHVTSKRAHKSVGVTVLSTCIGKVTSFMCNIMNLFKNAMFGRLDGFISECHLYCTNQQTNLSFFGDYYCY